jgi:hypothetical protein
MDYNDSAKEGEHILRITVDGVLIPFGRQQTDEQSQQEGRHEPDKPS